MAANQAQNGIEGIVLVIADVSASGAATAPSAPGTYPINSGMALPAGESRVAYADLSASDSGCKLISSEYTIGVSGSVSIDRVSGGAFAGSYDLQFDSGDRVQGFFSGTACGSIDNVNHPTCI